MTTRSDHWNAVYQSRNDTEVSWFDPDASETCAIVTGLIAPGDPVIDIGAGASRLVDRLLAEGFGPVDVLDVSEAALAVQKQRLGPLAERVGWIAADVTQWVPHGTWALWHDRAVFHFITEDEDRTAYVRTLARALQPGGHAVLSTFADDGPETCSGLPVVRYAPEDLARTFDALAPGAFAPGAFAPVSGARHVHRTPTGGKQSFQTSVFRRL